MLLNAIRAVAVGAGALLLAGSGAQASGPESSSPSSSWTGVYVGGSVSASWTNMDWGLAYTNPAFFNNSLPESFSLDQDNVIRGGQIGLNYQMGRWVLGGELSLSGGFGSSKITGVDLWQGSAVGEVESKIDWLFTATGRLGYA